jgi:hypothetical protein
MNGMMEAFKALAPNKDLSSFQVGYYCRQEHIEILQEENMQLRANKAFYENKKMVIESLERLFTSLLTHENSECGHCLFCENQWLIIEMIQDKLEDLKK